jgi:hypothetical protein
MLDRIAPGSAGDMDIYGAARQVRDTDRAGSFRLKAVSGVPATPPSEVLNALDGAQRVDQELSSRGLSVSFDTQPDGGVTMRLLDTDGSVVNDLQPTQALAAISGDAPITDLFG